jgi:MFS family permease
MASKAKTEGSSLFYGWYVLAASFVILFFNAGARSSISVMFKPIAAEFGWNRGTVSFTFFLQMVLFASSLSLIGRFYDRYGPKWVIIISTLFISIGYMFIAFIDTLWQFLLFYSVIAAVGLGGTAVPIFAAISSKWFEKGRAFAASLSLSGNCIGQFVLVPVMTYFVISYGWRISHFLIGVVMLVVNTALALLVIKGDPEDLGLKPYGPHEGEIPEEKNELQASDVPQVDMSLAEAMKTRSFWFIFTFMLFCGTADFLVSTHFIPFVTDYGISPTSAGNMLAWLGLLGMAGILVAGPIADRIGNKIPLSMVFFLRVLILLMIVKYQNPLSLYVFALLFAFTFLITAPLLPALIGKLFGFSHVGLISGFLMTFHYLGGGLGAYLGGLIFDITGSYQNAFLLLAMMSLLAAFSCILIREKRHDPYLKRSQQVAAESGTP